MAGNCCGSVRVLPRLDPAACNALTQTASGLLVPRTVLSGIAPGGATSAERSVDIDVTVPPEDACPQAWQVGARLTPVSGQTSGAAGLDTAPFDTWIPIPGAELTLPEAGVYEVVADVQGALVTVGDVANAAIDARLFDVTSAAAVPLTARRVLLFAATPSTAMHNVQGNASAAALYQVPGPTTIRVEASKHVDSGTTNSQAAWATNFRYKKVSD